MRLLKNNTIKQCVKIWGKDRQMLVAAEECAELIQAITKHLAKKSTNEENIKEELADVIILCSQLALIYGDVEINRYINKKLQKLNKRLATLQKYPLD